jgi:hypothetical protein
LVANSNVANFFWIGELTIYEIFCINSFLKNGFKVNLWSYEDGFNKNIFDNNNNLNILYAGEIVDLNVLYKFKQDSQKYSISSFTNLFRYKLLKQNYGWWFDSDCLCLKNVSYFEELANHKEFVLGREEDKKYGTLVNGSVMYLRDDQMIDWFIDYIENKLKDDNVNFYWGEIGPNLITKKLKDDDKYFDTEETNIFYPIDASSFELMFSNNKKNVDYLETITENSYVIHLWNEMTRRHFINKNKLPPKNSFLYKKFLDIKKNHKYGTNYYFLFLRFLPIVSKFYRLAFRINNYFTSPINPQNLQLIKEKYEKQR